MRKRGVDVGIVHVFRRIRVDPFVVVVVFRFRQSLTLAPVISLFPFSFSRFGVSIFVLVFVLLRIVVSFLVSFSFSVCRVSFLR